MLHWSPSVLSKQPRLLPGLHEASWDLTRASLSQFSSCCFLVLPPYSLCSSHLISMSTFIKHEIPACLTAPTLCFSLPEAPAHASRRASSKSCGCHFKCHLRSHPRHSRESCFPFLHLPQFTVYGVCVFLPRL